MITACKICGLFFETDDWRKKTCSIKCKTMAKAIVKKNTRAKHGDKNRMIEVTCVVCGKKVFKPMRDYNRAIKRNAPFMCSMQCVWANKLKGRYKNCSYCGKETWVTPATEKQYNYCSRECMKLGGEFRPRGDTHYRWRDDVTSRPYYRGSHWKMIRNRIRERDGYTCQVCGITEKELGKKMDVHHITPYRLFETDEEANVYDNLICLCPSCHHREDARIKE